MCRSLRNLRKGFGDAEAGGPPIQVDTIHRFIQQSLDVTTLQLRAGFFRPYELGKDQILTADEGTATQVPSGALASPARQNFS
jgi:hypothetical protein